MPQLLGEFDCTMDTKGRIRLPSGLLKQLGEANVHFVLNKGFEKCLTLYPQQVWDETVSKFDELNPYDTDTRNFLRRFHNGATPLEVDDQSRILIPRRLAEYASIEKEVILSAYGNKIEVWDAAEYERSMNNSETNMADLAQKVLGGR